MISAGTTPNRSRKATLLLENDARIINTIYEIKLRNMNKKIYTKRPMVLMSSFRLPTADVVLLREAAACEGISQSEFLRRAVKEQALAARIKKI